MACETKEITLHGQTLRHQERGYTDENFLRVWGKPSGCSQEDKGLCTKDACRERNVQ